MTRISRRDALLLGASLCIAGRAFAVGRVTRADFERMTIIDGNSAIIEPDRQANPEDPPTDRLLRAVRESGLTAISMTLGQGTDGDHFGTVIRKMAAYGEKIAAAPDVLTRVRTVADIHAAKRSKRLGLIYNVQDTMLLGTDISRIAALQRLGLRIVQLTYNRRNLVGDGALENQDGGLSNFGRQVVEELNRHRMVVDLSHGGPRLISQAIAASRLPPVISHSGCRALVDLPRNVRDEEMRALADRGGVIGIYFMPFLSNRPPATAADVFRHIEHAVNICGEDHVGIGTDGAVTPLELDDAARRANRAEFEDRKRANIAAPGETPDGEYVVPDYNQPSRMWRLAEDLSRRGWPVSRIEKLFGGNFLRVFGEVWG